MTVSSTIGGGQRASVRGEGYRVHRVRMAGQGLAERVGPVPVREIPHADGSVCVGGGQGAPVGGDGHAPDSRGVTGQWLAQLAGPVPFRQIPQDDRCRRARRWPGCAHPG